MQIAEQKAWRFQAGESGNPMSRSCRRPAADRQYVSSYHAGCDRDRSDMTGAEVVSAIHTPHVAFLLAASDPRITSLAESFPAKLGIRPERHVGPAH